MTSANDYTVRISHYLDSRSCLSIEHKVVLNYIWMQVRSIWEDNYALGHGPDHAYRVLRYSYWLSLLEGAQVLDACAGALLHDCGLNSHQLHYQHEERGARTAEKLLSEMGLARVTIDNVIMIIRFHSGSRSLPIGSSLETRIVRDADVLDRIGYTGVKITLEYGCLINRPLYSPIRNQLPNQEPAKIFSTVDYLLYLLELESNLMLRPSKKWVKRKIAQHKYYLSTLRKATELAACDYEFAFQLLELLESQQYIEKIVNWRCPRC